MQCVSMSSYLISYKPLEKEAPRCVAALGKPLKNSYIHTNKKGHLVQLHGAMASNYAPLGTTLNYICGNYVIICMIVNFLFKVLWSNATP